jgi:hypothetical protein
MNPSETREEKLKRFSSMTDEELLALTNVGAVSNSDSNLANAVLQHRLSQKIGELTDSTDRYSKLLVLLTMLLIFLGVYQIIVALVQPTGDARYIYLILFGVAFFAAIFLWGNVLFKKSEKEKTAGDN